MFYGSFINFFAFFWPLLFHFWLLVGSSAAELAQINPLLLPKQILGDFGLRRGNPYSILLHLGGL